MMWKIILFFLLVFSFENINACEVYITPLRKSFREANQVFLGEIISVEKKPDNDIPSSLDSVNSKYSEIYLLKLKIIKSWKGEEKGKEVIIFFRKLLFMSA